MKYIEKYKRYIDDDLVIYRMNKEGKLIQVKPTINCKNGYAYICCADNKTAYVHRLVYEAFIGEIRDGMEIDHINTIRTDNRLENLRVVTHKENILNPLTLKKFKEFIPSEKTKKKMSESHKGKPSSNKGKPCSDFGRKFKEHFRMICSDNINLYYREYQWYKNHNNKCRWE